MKYAKGVYSGRPLDPGQLSELADMLATLCFHVPRDQIAVTLGEGMARAIIGSGEALRAMKAFDPAVDRVVIGAGADGAYMSAEITILPDDTLRVLAQDLTAPAAHALLQAVVDFLGLQDSATSPQGA